MNGPNRTLAMALAIGVHVLFALLLQFSVRWQTPPTPPVELELWSPPPAASAASIPLSSAAVEAAKDPEPAVAPAPQKADPEPDIALQRPKPVAQKAVPEPAKPVKKLEEPLRQEKVPPKPAESGKPGAGAAKGWMLDGIAPPSATTYDAAAAMRELEARNAALKQSEQKKAFDLWQSQARDKIRRNIKYPDDLQGNPEAIYDVVLLPDMTVLEVTLRKSSGNPAYDEAVRRAIMATNQFPPLPSGFNFADFRKQKLHFRLREQ